MGPIRACSCHAANYVNGPVAGGGSGRPRWRFDAGTWCGVMLPLPVRLAPGASSSQCVWQAQRASKPVLRSLTVSPLDTPPLSPSRQTAVLRAFSAVSREGGLGAEGRTLGAVGDPAPVDVGGWFPDGDTRAWPVLMDVLPPCSSSFEAVVPTAVAAGGVAGTRQHRVKLVSGAVAVFTSGISNALATLGGPCLLLPCLVQASRPQQCRDHEASSDLAAQGKEGGGEARVGESGETSAAEEVVPLWDSVAMGPPPHPLDAEESAACISLLGALLHCRCVLQFGLCLDEIADCSLRVAAAARRGVGAMEPVARGGQCT